MIWPARVPFSLAPRDLVQYARRHGYDRAELIRMIETMP
jgi:hypothetical protein